MNYFLRKLAESLPHGDLRHTLVILPNRRSGAVLRQILVDQMPKGGYLPEITTLHAWAAELTEMETANNLSLKFALYDIYRQQMGEGAQTISQFFSWADILIGDFNDIDNYLIDPRQLFRNLAQYTEIEHFSFLEDPLSAKQKDYARFWNTLYDLFQAFRQKLLSAQQGYPGLIMSECLERLKTLEPKENSKIFIAGFNALTAAEFAIFKHLQTEHNAQVYFDLDRCFEAPNTDRAGYFVRKNRSKGLGNILSLPHSLADASIDLHIWEASSDLSQTISLRAILQTLSADELAKTAVVLADENLLIPAIEALPEGIGSPNITMGLPVGGGILQKWVEALFGMLHAQNLGGAAGQRRAREAFLDETLCRALFTSAEHKALLASLESGNNKPSTLEGSLHALLKGQDAERVQNLAAVFKWLAAKIEATHLQPRQQATVQAGVAVLLASLQEIKVFDESRHLDSHALEGALLKSLQAQTIDVLSEARDNLQITGLLETRALDYERLIICSVNEETLPGNKRGDSFIPFEIRNAKNLPGKQEKESVFAYYFYRLLQSAKHVTLIYNSANDGVKSGERSRYIHQLQYEWSVTNPNLRIAYFALESTVTLENDADLTIQKTPGIQAAIKAYIETGLSVSSLNKFYEDPLDWYYKYVLRLKTPDAQEDFDAAKYGSMIHLILEELYTPHIGFPLTAERLSALEEALPGLLLEVFEKEFPNRNLEVGEIRLRMEQMRHAIRKFIATEKRDAAAGQITTVKALELYVETIQPIRTAWGDVEVKLRGYIDRVATQNGKWWVIDYKSGKVDHRDLNFKVPADELKIANVSKGIQLLVYKRLLAEKAEEFGIRPGDLKEAGGRIISLQKPGITDLILHTAADDEEEFFIELLTRVVSDMLDPDLPIARNEKAKYAEFEV